MKEQTVNILGFTGHKSLLNYLILFSTEVAIDNKQISMAKFQ